MCKYCWLQQFLVKQFNVRASSSFSIVPLSDFFWCFFYCHPKIPFFIFICFIVPDCFFCLASCSSKFCFIYFFFCLQFYFLGIMFFGIVFLFLQYFIIFLLIISGLLIFWFLSCFFSLTSPFGSLITWYY